mmetsp:Transcript_94809/g.220072  ORF Transcript_94809/g.220072 Transcript_94809/m.220072 type:complete len:533 (+) Transcript_94809:95-1693(+)
MWGALAPARPQASEPGGGQQRHVRLVHEIVLWQRHDMVAQVVRDHMLRRDAGHVRRPAQPHDHLQLVLEHVHHPHNPAVSVGGQRVQHGSSHAAACSAQCNGLEDVSAPADATVHKDLELALLSTCFAQRLHDLGEHFDPRPARVELPPTVIGKHAAVQARLVRHDCVLGALHALEEDLHLCDALDPGHVLPAKAWIDVAADGTRRALRAVHLTCLLIVALHVRALLRELVAHVLFAPAKLRCIHGHKERLDTSRFKLLHILLSPGTFRVHIELCEELLSGHPSRKHLVKCVGAQGRQHVHHPCLLGRANDAHLAIRMCELGQGRCCEVEWQGAGHSQQSGGHVDLPNVHQDARPHCDALEGQVVVPQGDLIITTAGVVAPCLRLHHLPRDRLKVESVQHCRQWRLHKLASELLKVVVRFSDRLLGRHRLGSWGLRDVLVLHGRRVHDTHGEGGLEQLVHDVLGVDGVKESSGVHPCAIMDQLCTTGMHPCKLCQVVSLSVKHDPTVFLGVVLGHLFHGEHRGVCYGNSHGD